MESTITKKEVGEDLVRRIQAEPDFKTNSVTQFRVLQEHLKFCVDNYDHFTPAALEGTHQIMRVMAEDVEEGVTKMPDSEMKRQAARAIRGAKGKRLQASAYIGVLEAPVHEPGPLQIKVRQVFEKHLQTIMDLMQDVMANTMSGPADFCTAGLLAACVDELLAAFHFSQRFYAAQAFAHIRTVQEALDLIALFKKNPEWATVWASDAPANEV